MSKLKLIFLYFIGLTAASTLGLRSFYVVEFSNAFNLSPVFKGLVVSGTTFIGAVFGLLIGVVISQFGHNKSILLGLVALGISGIGTALSTNILLISFFCIIAGFGFTFTITAVPAMISSQKATKFRGAILTMWGAYLPVGVAMGLLFAAFSNFNWQTVFHIHGVGIFLVCVVFFSLNISSKTESKSILKDVFSVIWLPTIQRYAIGFCAFAALFLSTIVMLPTYLRTATDLSTQAAGLVVALICCVSVITCLICAYVLPKTNQFDRIFALGFVGTAISGTIFFLSANSPIISMAAAVAIFLFSSIIPSTIFFNLPNVLKLQYIATASGIIAQAGSIGSLIGPPMLSQGIDSFGPLGGVGLFLTLCLIGFIALSPIRLLNPLSNMEGIKDDK